LVALSGAVETNSSLRDNLEAFQEWGFVAARAARHTRGRNLKTTLFGQEYDAPFGLPPMGASALVAYRGDLVLTQAARARNVPMIMSASSLIPLEDVAKANPDAWYQAYLPGEAERIEPLVDRVAATAQDLCADGGCAGFIQPRKQCAQWLFHSAEAHAAIAVGWHYASGLGAEHLLQDNGQSRHAAF
jgi:isopentenyl diphosphate isomerase/L-lactate dehydrogenase-like FMN-dependent dehydrogenase